MKKLLVVLFFPIIFLGCISSGENITIHKDGSGTLVETFKVKREYVGFLNLSDQPANPNLIDMEALKKSATAMGNGVTLEKVEPMPEDSPFAGYKAYYHFEDISQVKANASPATVPDAGKDNSDNLIHFRFTPGPTAVLTILMPLENKSDSETVDKTTPAETSDGSTAVEDEGMKEQLKQIYKDMHFWIIISVDGKIVDTNAHHTDNSNITILDMTFDKIVDNDKLFTKITSDSSKNMDAYIDELTAAGVLIENRKTINISFK